MDLFQLMGTIAIEGAAQAVTDIQSVGGAASDTAGKIATSGSTIRGDNTTTGSSWQTLKSKVDEYKASGLSTSAAWSKATADMKRDTAAAEPGIVSSLKNIGAAVAGYLSVSAIVTFGKSCIDAASNVEEMENKFNVVFATNAKEVDQWATDYGKSIGRNKNDIKTWLADNQNMFVGMGMTRDQGESLSKKLVELGLDLASFNNLQDADAVNKLAKALMGETEAAKGLGAVLNENTLAEAQAQLGYKGKFESLTEAQKMEVRYQAILNQSQDAIGDCARSMGSYKATQNELNAATANLSETIGAILLPVATAFLGYLRDGVLWLTDMVNWLTQHKDVAAALAIVVGTLGAAILAYNVAQNASAIATGLATAATTAFGTVMAFITSPITLAVAAIAAITAGLYALYKNCEPVRNAVDKVVSVIKNGAQKEFERLKPYIDAIIWTMGELFKAIGEKVVAGFEWLVKAAQDLLSKSTPVIETFKTVFSNVFSAIQTIISTVWSAIQTIITTALTYIRLVIDTILAAVKGDWTRVWNDIQNAVNTVWNGIKTLISLALEAIRQVLINILNSIQALWTLAWNALKPILSNVWEFLKTTVNTAINAVKTTINTVMTAIKTFMTTTWNAIQTTASTVWNTIKTNISTIWEGIKTAVSNAINAVKTTVTTVLNGIQNAMSTAWNTIKQTTSTLWNNINTAISNAWTNIKNGTTTALSNVKTSMSNAWNAVKTTAGTAWNGIKSTITGVWDSLKTSVSTAVSSLKSTVTTTFETLKSTVATIWEGLKKAISTPMDAARDAVKTAIDKIKGLFNFTWSWPSIKLPHFKISGGSAPYGVFGQGKAPSVGIEWYAKAMDNPIMFNQPTIFGINPMTGNALGAGEAGDEVMIGKDTMLNMVQEAVARETNGMSVKLQRIADMMAKFFPDALASMQQPIVLDTGVLVTQTASAMDAELGRIALQKGRGHR